MDQRYWDNKRVFVTGGDGFIGSHLVERLVSYGAKVIVFVRDASLISGSNLPRLNNIGHLKEKISLLAGDISSADVSSLIKQEEPRVIFHLAADAYVNKSFQQPREVIRTNVDGTLNILDACLDERKKPLPSIEQVVITSSSEIYGTYDDPIDESFPMKPSSPYGASKAAADRLAYSYFFTYGLPVSIIRPFNTYGPRHTYDAPPKFISLALQGKPITIYGDGQQSRDLMYVDDVIEAFLLMGSDTRARGEAVNFGTGNDTRIIDLARKIMALSGSSSPLVHLPQRASEVRRLCCNPKRAKQLFGWEAQVSLEEGLRKNIAWAREAYGT